MIPMSCPNCGRQGEVPLDRLNSRLKCKKCGTMFYMDQTGSIVLGDPNDPKAKKRRKKAEDRRGADIDLDFGRMIRDIPKPVKVGLAALVVVAALGYGTSRLVGSLGTPDDVQGRSAVVADLFVDNKQEELTKLAVPGTEGDVIAWYELMRPQLNFEGPRRNKHDVITSGAIMMEAGASATSFAMAVVTSGGALPPTSANQPDDAPKNSLTMTLFWNNQDGQWLLDGTRTLEEARRPPPRRGGNTRGRGPSR